MYYIQNVLDSMISNNGTNPYVKAKIYKVDDRKNCWFDIIGELFKLSDIKDHYMIKDFSNNNTRVQVSFKLDDVNKISFATYSKFPELTIIPIPENDYEYDE